MIAVDTKIQDQINHVVAVEHIASRKEEILLEIKKLKEMGTAEHLLQQLIYFRANMRKVKDAGQITSDRMESGMNTTLYIIGTFLTPTDQSFQKISSLSAQFLIKAVVPYLETEDPNLKKELYRILKIVDLDVAGKQVHPKYSEYPVDYTEYKLFMEVNRDNLSEPLVQYMYQKSPGDALLTLAQVYLKDSTEKDSVIQAVAIIREDFWKRYHGPAESRPRIISVKAMQALDQLSARYPQWWIQMYVVEIILREPRFINPQILERLKNAKHPFILEKLEKTSGK